MGGDFFAPVEKSAVQRFWNDTPCGSKTSNAPEGEQRYFEEIERHRYALNPEMLEMADFAGARGQRVLEVGCGMGTDLIQFARAGAFVTGVDLTRRSVMIAQKRLTLEGLRGEVLQADAESLPFADALFDRVYSFGVIHHTPDIEKAVAEIHRVLRPGGLAIVMLYHRHSIQYLIGTLIFRRAGFALLRKGVPPAALAKIGGYRQEIIEAYARQVFGRAPLSRPELLAFSTDGPGNPLSRVFTRSQARRLFRGFETVDLQVRYLTRNCIPLVARRIPHALYTALGKRLGADLYVRAWKHAT